MSRVVVIGAGWAGLVAAKTYLQIEPQADLTIVDSDSTLGGTWSKDRLYPNLLAEAHYGLFEYSDLAMSPEGIQSDGRIPGESVHRYLDEYATKFNLKRRLRLNSKVTRVNKTGKSKTWSIELENTKELLLCEKLIVATGLTSEPFIPTIPSNDFVPEILHTILLGLPGTIQRIKKPEINRVLIYGGSKSAFDAVSLLLRFGKQVDWIIRPGNGPSIMTPLRILGSPSFRLSNSRCMGLFSPTVFDLSSLWHRLVHGPKSSLIARNGIKAFWKVLTYLTIWPANYTKSDNGKNLQPQLGLMSLFWSSATLGVMTQPELWEDIHSGKAVTVQRKEISSFSGHEANFSDGTNLQVDLVVLATGWKTKHSIFPDSKCLEYGLPSSHRESPESQFEWTKLESDGEQRVHTLLPLLKETPTIPDKRPAKANTTPYRLYRHVAPATLASHDRSIAFIGMLRTTGAPIVFEAQALWAAAYLTDRMKIPRRHEMQQEVALTNAWIKSRYICGHKVPFALFDFMAYIDILYKDLGINSHRKGNFINEIFGLYEPRDFKGVVDEFLVTNGERMATGLNGIIDKNLPQGYHGRSTSKPSSTILRRACLAILVAFIAIASWLVLRKSRGVDA